MRVPGLIALGFMAFAAPALALEEPMPRTFDLDWTCGRVLTTGAVSGDGGSFALLANGARYEYWIADGDQARLGPVVSAITPERYVVLAVGSDLRTGRAYAVQMGRRGATCDTVTNAAQVAYAEVYDAQTGAVETAPTFKPKLTKIPRPQAKTQTTEK